MVLDSLRHWVSDYHVDGFRFDLAPTLLRQPYDVCDRAGFLYAVGQDPVLSRVKLIAEPWDVGAGGYRVGGFPPGWSEWNDQFRDTIRAFWRNDPGKLPALARAMTGSREIFEPSGRQPWASINFVCSHDGFTLADLVSYDDRHNEANGEDNQDGHGNNLSWNCGVEGPTDDRGDPGAAGAPEAQSPCHRFPVAGRADAADGRRAVAHPERQQQRLLPGQRDQLARLGGGPRARSASFRISCAPSTALAPPPRRVPPPRFLTGESVAGNRI